MAEHNADSIQFTLGELATMVSGTVDGSPEIIVKGINSLNKASKSDICYLSDPKLKSDLENISACALVISQEINDLPEIKNITSKVAKLIVANPKLAFTKITRAFYPKETFYTGVHPTSVVGKGCIIGENVHVGPNCVIGHNVEIGDNTVIQAGCYIGNDVTIGESVTFQPKVSIYSACKIHDEVEIKSGAVIGSDGFGYAPDNGKWLKIPQIGRVVIGARSQIGANTTIDRGAIEDTIIEQDVIIDNLVHIAHNVRIGQGTAIAACTAIAGSTKVGRYCLIGGGSKINGHIEITDQVMLVACSNVAHSIKQAGAYGSSTSVTDIGTWKRNNVRFRQLDKLALRVASLEKSIKDLGMDKELQDNLKDNV